EPSEGLPRARGNDLRKHGALGEAGGERVVEPPRRCPQGVKVRTQAGADRSSRHPQAFVGGGLEGAVVNQGHLHRATPSRRAGSNQASFSANAATSPM